MAQPFNPHRPVIRHGPFRGEKALGDAPGIDLLAHELAAAAAAGHDETILIGRDVSISSAIRMALAGVVTITRGHPQRLRAA